MLKKIAAFGLVGGVGFITDAGVLTLLSQHYGCDVYLSRVFSFITATLVTWLLNRTVVFSSQAAGPTEKRREYKRYFLVQVGGALLNLAAFSILIAAFPVLHALPVVPLAVGAVFGLMFNFTGARLWVFNNKNLADS